MTGPMPANRDPLDNFWRHGRRRQGITGEHIFMRGGCRNELQINNRIGVPPPLTTLSKAVSRNQVCILVLCMVQQDI